MQPEQQQRIMGYFIEEAKDHLNTIEQGLLKLQHTLDDPEIVNEMFRAAHSVKGGAAMLGLNSIQYVSHRLEDFFKVMSEAKIEADQRLETLLLRVFDALQALIEQLQGPFGLTDETTVRILSDAEPLFGKLESHLQLLKQTSLAHSPTSMLVDSEELDLTISSATEAPFFPNPFEPAWKTTFRNEVPVHLRTMLALFKTAETSNARQQLQQVCDHLVALDNRDELENWRHLIGVSRQAIAAPDHTFRNIAPLIIREIKQAYDLILADQVSEIAPSDSLIHLAAASTPVTSPDVLTDISWADGLSEPEQFATDVSLQPINDPLLAELQHDSEHPDDLLGDFLEPSIAALTGPEIGTTELDALADLFEGELPDLDEFWQEEDLVGAASAGSDTLSSTGFLQGESDFLESLLDQDEAMPLLAGTPIQDELGALFGNTLGEEGQFPADNQNSERTVDQFELSRRQPEGTESLDLDDLFSDFVLTEDNQASDAALACSEAVDEPAEQANELPDFWAEPDQPSMAATTEPTLSLANIDFSDLLAQEDPSFEQLLNEEAFPLEFSGDLAAPKQFDVSELLDSAETPVTIESLLGDEVLDRQSDLLDVLDVNSIADINPIVDIEAIPHYADLDLSLDGLEESQLDQTMEPPLENQEGGLLPIVEDSPHRCLIS